MSAEKYPRILFESRVHAFTNWSFRVIELRPASTGGFRALVYERSTRQDSIGTPIWEPMSESLPAYWREALQTLITSYESTVKLSRIQPGGPNEPF